MILLVLALLQPLHFLPWISWHNEVLAFAAVLLLAWQGVIRAGKNDFSGSVAFPATVIPLVGLLVLIWIQFAIGRITFFGDALVLSIYIIGCIVSLALGMAVSGNQRTYTALAWTLLVSAFLSGALALVQIFDVWESFPWINRMAQQRRPGGNLGQPNQLATLLLMGLASLVFLFETKKLGRVASVLLALSLLVGLAISESRTGILSFFVLAIWWFAKRKTINFKLSPWLVMLAGTGFLFLFWRWPVLMDEILQSGDIGAKVNTGLGGRWLVWPQLFEAIWQRPWFGWGFGQVSTAHNAVVDGYASSEPFTYAHNILLDIALGVGIPVAVLFGVMSMVWLWRRLKSARTLVPWYCLAIVLPVAMHSLLEFPFAYAYFLLPVMFSLGALEGLAGIKPAIRLGVKTVAAILLGSTVIMAWSVVEYVSIEEDFRIVRFEALKLGRTPSDYERPKVVLLTQLDALLKGGRIVPKPGMSADEVALARTVALRYPWPATQSRYALSLALNGNPNEAIRQLRVMRALHGEKTYAQVRDGWRIAAAEKYPQLKDLTLP
jgi:O-antigen ligase